jgi:alanine dehydrogenase
MHLRADRRDDEIVVSQTRKKAMRIGCPKEIKVQERRVGLTPDAAREAVAYGHEVIVETGAGLGSGHSDAAYEAAGARILGTAAEIFDGADLVVKVKEPQASERAMLREGQVLFTYLHLAPDPAQTRDLLASGVTAIAYETVTGPGGALPLLAPMSEVAGRLAPQMGAWAMQAVNGGRGLLMGGVPGTAPARVAVIGGGVVGTHAARIAAGMGAQVVVLDRSLPRMRLLDDQFGTLFRTRYASKAAIEEVSQSADIIIGAVLVVAAAPKLLSRAQIAAFAPGAVLVDVAIDQGGCFETSHATTHDDPIYVEEGAVHYCVANMPGAAPRTATEALGAATLPFMIALANKGWRQACGEDPHLLAGLNVHAGRLTLPAAGEALGIEAIDACDALML